MLYTPMQGSPSPYGRPATPNGSRGRERGRERDRGYERGRGRERDRGHDRSRSRDRDRQRGHARSKSPSRDEWKEIDKEDALVHSRRPPQFATETGLINGGFGKATYVDTLSNGKLWVKHSCANCNWLDTTGNRAVTGTADCHNFHCCVRVGGGMQGAKMRDAQEATRKASAERKSNRLLPSTKAR